MHGKLTVNKKIVFRSEVNGFRVLAFDTNVGGEWRSALMVYIEYGDSEPGSEKTEKGTKKKYRVLDWSLLRTSEGITPWQRVTTTKELEMMYRVLLARMKEMGKGDQLSPDFQGKTPEVKGDAPAPPTPALKRTRPDRPTLKRKAVPARTPNKTKPTKRRTFMDEDDDDDDDL